MILVDLFSGVGGFSLAADSLGMETVAFCECEPYPVRVMNRHWPDVPVFPDVKELTADALADATQRHAQVGQLSAGQSQGTDGRVPMQHRGGRHSLCLTAGFPCQDLSYAGKGAGLSGERSGLYGEVIRLVRDLQPEWVLLENVNAILSRGVGTVLGDLAACGYGWAYGCVPACAVGAPHRRDRWWAVAWPTRGDIGDNLRGERIWTSVLQGLTPLPHGMWTTPIANEAEKRGDHNEGLRGQVVTWPTPHANAHTGAGEHGRGGDNLQTVAGGSLNPDWVETLMGYPIGYTIPEGEPMREIPDRWPAGLGAQQHDWEPPRLTTVKTHRAARLKALGNSIVPHVARLWLNAVRIETVTSE